MHKMALFFTLILVFLSGTLSLLTREEYEDFKKNVEFEVLEYEKVVEIFKDMKPSDPDLSRKIFLEDEMYLLSKYKEQTENDNFLALQTKLALPKEFDWTKIKPECFTPVINQSNCGSCFIFATVSVLEERICIHSAGKVLVNLSQQDVLSCDTNHDKCNGGSLGNTWEYLENVGTCSYSCKPYISYNGSVPKCSNSCENPKMNIHRWKAVKNSMKIMYRSNEDLKNEIYLNGPVSSHMETWEDLSIFKGGIYIHSKGIKTDPHAVNIVGWGFSDIYRQEYWIVRNSWGSDWGDNGYFKVLFNKYSLGQVAVASLPLI
jgi:C1A family cysteine protease